MRGAILANLILYAIVASQPLAYLVFLGKAQRALSASAYIELRQRINPVMTRRLPVIYLLTLAAGVWVSVLALRAGHTGDLVPALIGLLCLVVDVFFMLRENVPINGAIDRWSPAAPPADWEDYRRKWFAVFAPRQAVLLFGFVALLAGAVLR